jgi:hypothetical protein
MACADLYFGGVAARLIGMNFLYFAMVSGFIDNRLRTSAQSELVPKCFREVFFEFQE